MVTCGIEQNVLRVSVRVSVRVNISANSPFSLLGRVNRPKNSP